MQALIDAGQTKFAIVKTWFGGSTAAGLQEHLGNVFTRARAAGKDVSLTLVFLREAIGYEKKVSHLREVSALTPIEGVTVHELRLQMVLGEDSDYIYNKTGIRSLKIFNLSGEIREISAGTTREMFLKLMAGH